MILWTKERISDKWFHFIKPQMEHFMVKSTWDFHKNWLKFHVWNEKKWFFVEKIAVFKSIYEKSGMMINWRNSIHFVELFCFIHTQSKYTLLFFTRITLWRNLKWKKQEIYMNEFIDSQKCIRTSFIPNLLDFAWIHNNFNE